MQAVCFECDVVIEAADSLAVADRFVEHAAQSHEWSYPEESLRNYARNCAEAPGRLTGATERLAEIGAITIYPVSEDRIDDWLHFFDHDGFAGHPDWASCYCRDPHDPGTPDEERLWSANRRMMVERLHTGGSFGYLAYVDGRVAGWVTRADQAAEAGEHVSGIQRINQAVGIGVAGTGQTCQPIDQYGDVIAGRVGRD